MPSVTWVSSTWPLGPAAPWKRRSARKRLAWWAPSASPGTALVHEVRRQDAGLMTTKTVSRRNWPESADHTYSTW